MAKKGAILSIPVIQKTRIGLYIIGKLLAGKPNFPLVLMLEPLFRCNLRCKGCGKLAHSEEILARQLSAEECVEAAEECGAPVVSIAGGEPLLHPDISLIAQKLADRKRFVYLCTNAILVRKRINEFKPSPYLTFNIHLDGLRDRHDTLVCRRGVFDQAVAATRLLVSKGFRVTTNTTLYGGEYIFWDAMAPTRCFGAFSQSDKTKTGDSTTAVCIWTFWRAANNTNVRPGAIRPAAFWGGRDPAT